MITIIVGLVAFVIGVAVGIIWTNRAISNLIGQHFGW